MPKGKRADILIMNPPYGSDKSGNRYLHFQFVDKCLDEYNIMDKNYLNDVDGNGKYDVRDFLNLENNEIIDMNNKKKFDICLMNPPYDKNLHLKFLEKVANISDKVVSIQPVRWLLDPFANNKRSTLKSYENIAKNINDIEIISNKEQETFDIAMYSDLGIYYIDNNDNNKIDYNNFWKGTRTKEEINIIQKVCLNSKCKYISEVAENNKRDGIRVLIAFIGGNRGNLPIYKDIKYAIDGYIDGKDWTKCKNMGGYEKPVGAPMPFSIKFKTTKEAENFWESYYNLQFFKVISDLTIQQQHIQLDRLPFLNDYTHKITNNECYKLFDLSDDEIKYIENYYKN